MRVAIAHDFIRHGGAERVLEQMHRLWPEAPIHTLLAEPNPAYAGWDIRSSFLQGRLDPKHYRWPLLLYPWMVERLRFAGGLDLLVSSSVSWMKAARAPEGVPHLCYIYRPMMFAYERQDVFLASYPAPVRPLLKAAAAWIRRWDQRTSDRPTLLVTLSRYIANRIREIYGRESLVIPPPVRVEPFEQAGRAIPPGEYFLSVLRLESYKRVDIIVEACSRLGLPLKVAGRGPELDRLRAMAGPTVEFLGYVRDEELPALVAGCRAFLFSAEEDFGISPVEAQAAGRPVIAYGAGGCLETVVDGETGMLFPRQTAASLAAALESFDPHAYDPERARAHALRYSERRFREALSKVAERLAGGEDPARLLAEASGSGSGPL